MAARVGGQTARFLSRATAGGPEPERRATIDVPFPFEPPLPPGRDGAARPPLVPSRLPDGRSVQAVLAEEGFSARIDAQKQTVLAAHLDAARLSALEALVHGNAPPMTPGLREPLFPVASP